MKTARLGAVVGCAASLAAAALGQGTERASVATGGAQGNGSSVAPALSADGRFIAFASIASNLVPGDTNANWDIFVRDRQTGTTERAPGGGSTFFGLSPSMSGDGRYVAYATVAAFVVPGDTNGAADVFVYDRQSATIERVSVGPGGVEADDDSFTAAISADGRYVVFSSLATNLVAGDTNSTSDVFVHDRQTDTTERVSVFSSGNESDNPSLYGALSADGRYVAFGSLERLANFDTDNELDIFVRDRQTGITEFVSVNSAGFEGLIEGACYGDATLSADGRYVAFSSSVPDLAAGDANGLDYDVFLRDRQAGTTVRVSVDSSESGANGAAVRAVLSADGRRVAFVSHATNLVPGDTNGSYDVFVRDLPSGTTKRVSVDSAGAETEGAFADLVALSVDGSFVAFSSMASDLVPGDTNATWDVFVHEDATGFTSVCTPGASGATACPCSNPPAGADRGCTNSSATGGAYLTASGGAALSADTLVFTTGGEKPTALSIVLQGNAFLSPGVPYGQGVRCLGGALKRLYVKAAVGGSITAPDFGAGELPVSTRSAALGDPIGSGQSRWYLVYYRDPIVLGGCPAASAFNATQTGRVDWEP